MTLERDDWERLDALLDQALSLPRERRARFLDAACAGESEVRRRLEVLIRDAEAEDGTLAPLAAAHADPPLPAGATLGRYQIRGMLGTGGVGRVYRAFDPTLGREVAIKALGGAFRRDVAALRRFEREARLLGALNHPHVAAIHGFELLDGTPYLVLELIEGATLQARLDRGALAVSEALEIARQVAEGVEEAHRKGVIHRDLKPSNVMITPAGHVKVLDFGLAKSVPRGLDPAFASVDATPSLFATTASGTILGTAPYMSPEQVRGEDVDARTDVWAFGCLLYEMLSGRRCFAGDSIPDVLASVLRDEPDWSALPAELSPAVRRLLRRCLRKDTRERLRDLGDARLDLADDSAEVAPPRRASLPVWLAWACTLAASVAAIGLASRAAPPPARLRLALELPRGMTLADDPAPPFALSGDGTRLVLLAASGETRRLYARRLDQLQPQALAGTEGAVQPTLAPDGAQVAFFAERKLRSVPVDGGPVVTWAEVGGNPRGAAWLPDGSIVIAPSQTSGLRRIPAGGGPAVDLTTLGPGESSHRWPTLAPGGRSLLFTVGEVDESFDHARIDALELATGARRSLVAAAGFARCVPGALLFVRGGRLHAQAFDFDRLEPHGEPEIVVDGVRYEPSNGGAHLATSAAGTLVFTPGLPTSNDHYLAWLGQDGRLQRIVGTPRSFREPRLSPTGGQSAVVLGAAGEADLWTVDLVSATFTRHTSGLRPRSPVWAPDGRSIAIGVPAGSAWQILRVPLRGGAPAVLHSGPRRMYPCAWSPDGRELVFQELEPATGWDLHALSLDASGRPGAPRAVAATPFHETSAAFSPDGRLLAYESDELDGVFDVYVRGVADAAARLRVTTAGARYPRFDAAGRLFAWSTSQRRVVVSRLQVAADSIRLLDAPDADAPLPAFEHIVRSAGASYDVDPSGTRYLVLESSASPVPPEFGHAVVVVGWRPSSH